ncbi:hypothetical protein [Bifidobacterium choloepi]|uniref:Uncharacterized protein n=1 Tax=Bifidobacterium choloepi TaxID=2614131 RepID=A0A6I5MYE1_9BIFI|nr:hypothetical protein [Bifidobacterium choloepi]NEG69628.1 hypothetical protein [Bifidobacterium choloepi]
MATTRKWQIGKEWNMRGLGVICPIQLVMGVIDVITLLIRHQTDPVAYILAATLMGLGTFGTVLALFTDKDNRLSPYGFVLSIVLGLLVMACFSACFLLA